MMALGKWLALRVLAVPSPQTDVERIDAPRFLPL